MPITIPTFDPFPREGLRALVARLQVPIVTVWAGQPRPFLAATRGKPGAVCELDVSGIKKLGMEEWRYFFDPVLQCNVVQIFGQREYGINFRIESFDFDVPAYENLENLGLSLRNPATRRGFPDGTPGLHDLGLAFVRCGAVRILDIRADTRPIFAAEMNVDFAWVATNGDVTADGGVIETVNTTDGVPDLPALTSPPL
jgi:hypothetical protein